MATVPEETYATAIDAVSGWWSVLRDRLAVLASWLVVAAFLLAYGLLYAALLGGATIAAMSLGEFVPGTAGFVVAVTVGLVLVAAAPTVARQLFHRALDAMESRG